MPDVPVVEGRMLYDDELPLCERAVAHRLDATAHLQASVSLYVKASAEVDGNAVYDACAAILRGVLATLAALPPSPSPYGGGDRPVDGRLGREKGAP